ncbi:hypothetical protein KOR42_22980 [Thalassoglobus neptunius]|uniref:Uncharacterized protein n=1 Tax=Thalassoglobus neptunius TaxID=1938619 RepID=A0A5C5X956_9PLAN|nr:hypothetical protein [Thalassoglobus neptunius]TWT58911.1 hypothetical protein KOR42_22980 [Thalassoglobus neptunius]
MDFLEYPFVNLALTFLLGGVGTTLILVAISLLIGFMDPVVDLAWWIKSFLFGDEDYHRWDSLGQIGVYLRLLGGRLFLMTLCLAGVIVSVGLIGLL